MQSILQNSNKRLENWKPRQKNNSGRSQRLSRRKNRSSFEPAIAEPDEQTAVQQQSKEPEKAAKKHKLFGRNKKSRNEES